MTFLEWLRGVGVTLSGLIGSCYGDAWNITFRDPCEAATEHLSECIDAVCSGDCGGGEVICEGSAACSAGCINDASCEEIRDVFSGTPTERSKAFLDCATQCAASAP